MQLIMLFPLTLTLSPRERESATPVCEHSRDGEPFPMRRNAPPLRGACHCLHLVLARVESQRDSITKPRVARHELPWVWSKQELANPEGVAASDRNGPASPRTVLCCNPFRVEGPTRRPPRVARASQPWAGRYNPFGIEKRRVELGVMTSLGERAWVTNAAFDCIPTAEFAEQ
jgi:hypothetical protein